MKLPRRVVLCALLGACDPSPQAAPSATASVAPPPVTRATITLDAAHDVTKAKDAPAYVIAPSSELVVEIGDARLTSGDAGPVVPDAVHVSHGSSEYYRGSFKGARVTLGAATLDRVKGPDAFSGFEAGEPYVVAMGVEISAPDGAMRFVPAWAAKVTVATK